MSEQKLNMDRAEHAASLTGSPKISPTAPLTAPIYPVVPEIRLPVLTESINCWGKNEVPFSTMPFRSVLASAIPLYNIVNFSSIRLKKLIGIFRCSGPTPPHCVQSCYCITVSSVGD